MIPRSKSQFSLVDVSFVSVPEKYFSKQINGECHIKVRNKTIPGVPNRKYETFHKCRTYTSDKEKKHLKSVR